MCPLPNAVRLATAYPFNYAVSGMSWDLTYVHAHAKNIGAAAARRVFIHYNDGAVWKDVDMTLEGDYGDHSRYTYDLPRSRREFVLGYETSAGTFWDNNDWQNYKVQAWSNAGGFLKGKVGYNVALGHAEITRHADRGSGTLQYILKGEIHVQNLNYNKLVGVRMNVEGVWTDFHASYSHSFSTGGGDNIEVWKFGEFGVLVISHPIITPEPPFPQFRFAAFYHDLDGGGSYWDNNFWQDYLIGQSGQVVR